MDLSQLLLELLRTDEEFVLYRGEYSNQPGSPPVLLLAPASMQPALETTKDRSCVRSRMIAQV